MAFAKLAKRPRRASNNGFPPRRSRALSVAGRLYEQAMDNKFKTEEGRRPEYRPSAFPLCSVLVYMRLVAGASRGYFESERSAAGDYFTSVGTTAHENIQFHMGFTGRVFGDWRCMNTKCKKGRLSRDLYDADGNLVRKGKLTRKNSVKHLCPSCDLPMEYVEKEINFAGLKGHIDCIIKLDDGRYWVADYKTTTKNKMSKGKLPEKTHLKQLPTYCYVLKKKYKLNVAGFSLLYISRDNPFEYLEYTEEWTSKWDARCKDMIDGERKKFKAGVNSFFDLDHEQAIKHKPCKTLAFYEKEIAYYTECPMLGVCFDNKKLNKALDKHVKQFPSKRKARTVLVEAINID